MRAGLPDNLKAQFLNDALERVMIMAKSQISEPFKAFLLPKLQSGKKLRPVMLLTIEEKASQKAIKTAAAIEMVHLASKLHDAISDEVLESKNLNLSLLAGDFLLATALRMSIEVDATTAERLAATIETMSKGQARQLELIDQTLSFAEYKKIIDDKTASLFAFACREGARLAAMSDEQIESFTRFGRMFGQAYQMNDDIVDNDSLLNNGEEIGQRIAKIKKAIKRDKNTLRLHALAESYLGSI